jgi:hypothetical protein
MLFYFFDTLNLDKVVPKLKEFATQVTEAD